MKRTSSRPPVEPRPEQQTSVELRDALLAFIRGKFYPDPAHGLAFAKDRPRLLEWVVFWPAKWLKSRGVTLPPERYQELIINALMEGLRHGATHEIRYLPAWLRQVVQSHFAHNEEPIYEEAKAIRTRVESALLRLGGRVAVAPPPDPVREMATAGQLLKARKPAKRTAIKGQLSLL